MYQKQVRKKLLGSDVVLPSLDAASDLTFRKINRPFHDININQYVQGLVDFRNEYNGKIWLEIFIIPGYNDNKNDLDLLKKAFERINPDSIQLNTLDRPGTVSKIRSASREQLQHIVDYWQLENVEIVTMSAERRDIKSYRDDIETAILETVQRRPCTLDDLAKILGLHINEINKYIDVLESDGKIETVRQKRGIFYKVKQ